MKTYLGIVTQMPDNGVFVFGSNTEGRHGKGAALYARKHFGARYGQARGLQGKSFGIVTTDLTKKYLPSVTPSEIISQIYDLYEYASKNPQIDFFISYGGHNQTYLCGYTSEQMAIFFSANERPSNIIFETHFAKLIIL